jgi:hypothetical protein
MNETGFAQQTEVLQKIMFPMMSLFMVVLLLLLYMLHLLVQPLHLLTHIFYLKRSFSSSTCFCPS